MNNQNAIRVISGILLATALLAGRQAWGAAGDLDPAFGTGGIQTPPFPGTLRAIREHGGKLILGGGDTWRIFELNGGRPVFAGYVGTLDADGSQPQSLWTSGSPIPRIDGRFIGDIAVRDDGSIVGVGQGGIYGGGRFVALRVLADGGLDPSYGASGVVAPSTVLGFSDAASVILDDAGRALIAGRMNDRVAVIRLSPQGSLDTTFGAGGAFVDDSIASGGSGRILRVTDGYRLAFHGTREPSPGFSTTGCHVVAIRGDGVPDPEFGDGGYAAIGPIAGNGASCRGFATSPEGGLFVAGSYGGRGFAIRLLGDGEPDPGFAAPDVATLMTSVTAVVASPDSSVLVAGIDGSTLIPVVRLHPDGSLDTSFGNAGTTWVPAAGRTPVVNAMLPTEDGGVVLGGGSPPDPFNGFAYRPFIARLLGGSAAGSPGAVGMTRTAVVAPPAPGPVVLNVRRIGGSTGAISVAYATQPASSNSATAGVDYVDTAGRLDWPDGDLVDRQIEVPILDPQRCQATPPLFFMVELSDPTGGSGLWRPSTPVTIAGHPAGPGGTVEFAVTATNVSESQAASLILRRAGSSECPASVTLTAHATTAISGEDYDFPGMTVEWPAGDGSPKTVSVPIVADDIAESAESFTVEIASASAGALVGSASAATINIYDGAAAGPVDEPGSGGGGAFPLDSLLLLALARLWVGRKPRPSRGVLVPS